MQSHVRILGAIHIVFGAMGLLGGLAVLILFGGIATLVGFAGAGEGRAIAVPVLGGIGGVLFLLALVLSLPGMIAGVGLLKMRPWARILTLILSVFNLLSVPFGTALGVYGFWVLLSKEGEQLFRG